MSDFTALRVHKTVGGTAVNLDRITLDDLNAGEVTIQVAYSSVNYKDALAVTGKNAFMRGYPRTAGIDLAGIVATSGDPTVHAGDKVLVTGCNIGESLDGGLAEFARVPGSAVVPLPTGLSLFEAMTLGTAGFTAAMALHRMLENHQTPAQGPIAVTGATGGVGSIAILLFKQAGFRVCAITGKTNYASRLIELGADEILDRSTLDLGSKPLERAVWGGAVDNLGGDILTYLTRTVRPWGNIACIGLAQSAGLTSTVMPLILRGVSLLGIHSIEVPRALRLMLWERLGGPWKPAGLTSAIVRGVIELKDVPRVCAELVAGQARGRYVVRIAGE
jgi:acrylyl-CoA reductase (NADPH)